jgi:hypothetical protein
MQDVKGRKDAGQVVLLPNKGGCRSDTPRAASLKAAGQRLGWREAKQGCKKCGIVGDLLG